MYIEELIASRQLWITSLNLLSILCRLTAVEYTTACRSFATVEVTEYDGGLRSSGTSRLTNEPVYPVTNSAPFSINLTDLLLRNVKLTESDLNESVFFADAEQSRPFLIQSKFSARNKNNSVDSPRWYQLVSNSPLDREQLCNINSQLERVTIANTCCSKSFNLPPDVMGSPANQPCCIFLGITVASKGTYILRLQINDVNDNPPKFGQPAHVANDLPYFMNVLGKNVIGVSENNPPNSWFPIPAAFDPDEGPNGAVRYTLHPLTEKTHWRDYFKLLNNVRAAGLPTNSTSVSFVLNNQKNVKHLDSSDYNGPGVLILQPLDREKIASFVFQLLATDMGTDLQLSSYVNIRIVILDENDNPPVFERSNYQVQLRENQAGVLLLNAKVYDADSDNNGRLSYYIQPSRTNPVLPTGFSVSADFLRIHIQLVATNDGVTLRVSQPLDYEKQAEFTFDLIAADNGHPSLSSTAHVHVKVINVNDFAPLIRFYYHGEPLDRDYARLSVLEQHETTPAAESRLICHVHVTDADSEFESISCTVESSERNFFLREVSTNRLVQRSKIYELLSTGRLDRESDARLIVLVRCRDGKATNSLVSQNQLQLILLDVNDHSPVFTQEHYHGSVAENVANAVVTFISPTTNTPIHNVQATDADSGINALIFYSILPWTTTEASHSDAGLEEKTEEATANATVTDKLQMGKVSNMSVRLRLNKSGEDADRFYVDQTSGQIRTRIPLDCEEQQEYRFFVLAIDQSEQTEWRHTATARITVTVRDENDNPPIIEQRHYTFTVKEGLPRHTRIGQIQSADADVSPESRSTVYDLKNLENCNASEYILVEKHTGYIRTRQVLDREETGQFSFIVVARNEQPVQESFRSHQTINTENGPTFFDEVSVTVSVEDENDNAPALLRRGLLANDRVPVVQDIVPSVIDLTFRVSQNETSNPCIEFPYLLVDDDEGANGQTEVIVENNSYFEFRLDNTLLCIVKLEQPTVSQMNLFITVQDKPVDKTKTLKRQYTIRVHFVEDKAPSDNLRQFEPFHASRFIANPTVLSSSETAENKPVRMENLKSGRKSKISNSRKTHYDVENNELLNQKPLASGATLMIVAILVAVSGLLCLLLLGVVLALRKATINGINATSSEYHITAKPRDDVNDDEDNSVLSGQRAELQHVYFASRHSPASYQTSNSGDRFRPVPQKYMWTEGSLDRGMTRLPRMADVNQMYAPELYLINNQLKSLSPSAIPNERGFPFNADYSRASLGQQINYNYERCDDQRDGGNYTKPIYSPLEMKLIHEESPIPCMTASKLEVEASVPDSANSVTRSAQLGPDMMTRGSSYQKLQYDSNVASTDTNDISMRQASDLVRETCTSVTQISAQVSVGTVKSPESSHEILAPKSMLKTEHKTNPQMISHFAEHV